MDWLAALQELRTSRTPAVIVTLAMVRGHAPRNGGAKMVVAPETMHGTVGGGNLEATAIDQARRMLASGTTEPELLTLTLSDKAVTDYGVQCCGGEVTMMLEPVPVVPSVAIFGVGHVGLNVKADNPAAIACYQKLGFARVADYGEYTAESGTGSP